MSEQTAVVESSPTPIDISRGPLVAMTPEQRTEFRSTGNLPTPPKKEDSASSSESGASETPKQQEQPKTEAKPKLTAEERIAQLEADNARNAATIEKIRKGAGLDKPKAEPSEPAKPEPKQETRSKPKQDDKKEDGSDKYETYEDFVEDLADWKSEQREAERTAKERANAQAKSLNDKLEAARNRYSNLDEVIQPAAEEIYQDKDIPGVIKSMIGDSEVMVDLVFTIASNKEDYAKFLTMARNKPGQAIRYLARAEDLIIAELEGKAAEAKPDTKTEDPPARPKTQAPKPPAEAGGRASAPSDSLKASLEASGGKLTADVKAEFQRRALDKASKG